MSLASVANLLGQTVIPQIAAAVFFDTCTIKAEALTIGSGGDRLAGSTDAYINVPCTYEPFKGARVGSGDKLLSLQPYTVTLPTHTAAGARINLDPAVHKIVTNARGDEPAKTFRIVSVPDQSGIVFEVLCEKEN